MTKNKITSACALLVATLLVSFAAYAQSASPQETLAQYIADLQKTPNDNALREKIIRHVHTMKTKPTVPLQAEKFEGRAEFAARSAKTESDFADAAKEYEKALLVAPWVAAYYFNLGVMQEKAGQPQEAKHSFELYLLAALDALDARDVRKRIAGLEYAIEKAAAESSPAAMAARERKGQEEWIKRIDGAKYTACNEYDSAECIHFSIRGNTAFYRGTGVAGEEGPFSIEGRRFAGWNYRCFDGRSGRTACVISEDGERITCTYCEGENPQRILKRER